VLTADVLRPDLGSALLHPANQKSAATEQ